MSFCLLKTQTVKKGDDVWLMPNKMINVAISRESGTPPISKPTQQTVRYLLEKDITNGLDEKTSNAFLKAYDCQKKINERREKKKIKLIDFIPIQETVLGTKTAVSRADKLKCKAMTITGKPCPFKASCGEFCKKHQQPDNFKL